MLLYWRIVNCNRMKKLFLISFGVAGWVLGLFAQGAVYVSDASIGPGVTLNSSSSFYSGPFTLQVWYLNASSVPGNINSYSGTSLYSSLIAYNNVISDGFTLAQTFAAANISDGTFNFGELDIPGMSPADGNAAFALVAWDNNASSGFGPRTDAGVIAFENPTADYTVSVPYAPIPPSFTGWNTLNQNLIMGVVPEPSAIALTGLGVVSFLIRRRQ